jgi:RNA-directed DNA polymerase
MQSKVRLSCWQRKCLAPWILEGDILGCFDNFQHEWLETHVPMNKNVLRGWLKAGYVESGKLFPTEAGLGPLRGILARTRFAADL